VGGETGVRGQTWLNWAAALGRNSGWAEGRFALFFFSNSNTFFKKQANKFEFKPRFESKHPKTMHQHECNSKLLYFIN
jgi:hypothetical protein